jgi:hypothetical protein
LSTSFIFIFSFFFFPHLFSGYHIQKKMTHVLLDNFTIEGLKDVVRQLELDTSGTRAIITKRLIDYYDSHGWPERITVAGPGTANMEGGDQTNREEVISTASDLLALENTTTIFPPAPNISNGRATGCSPAPNMPIGIAFTMQDIVQAVVQVMETNHTRNERQSQTEDPLSRSASSGSANSHLFTAHNWGQMKFASKLIPNFVGKDDENVDRWIERCISIARIHRISEETLVTAAVNQLTERAQNWYYRQDPETVATWPDFRFQLKKYFERKEATIINYIQ